MPNWTFVEPTLVHASGHQPAYLRMLRAAIPATDRVSVVVPAGSQGTARHLNLGEGIDVHAWPIALERGRGPGIGHWIRANHSLTRWLRRIGHDAQQGDIVTSISTPTWLLAGFAAGSMYLPKGVRASGCLYGFESPWNQPSEVPPVSMRIRIGGTVAAVRSAVARGSLVLGAQTPPVADAMVAVFGVQIQALPMLVHWDGPLAAPPSQSGHLPRLSWLGQIRDAKGFARYVRLATALRSQVAPHGQFTPDNQMSEREFEAALAPLRDLPGAQIHTGHADDATYAARFAESDLVALPYARSSYWQRTSGVLVETLGHGRVPVVSGDTWLADFARLYGGGIELGDESTDAEVVRAALPGLRERLARAAAAAPRVRAEHNATSAVQAMIRLAGDG